MEDTLRERSNNRRVFQARVLILVLMEDTLRVINFKTKIWKQLVLILVLMEDTLRVRALRICSCMVDQQS